MIILCIIDVMILLQIAEKVMYPQYVIYSFSHIDNSNTIHYKQKMDDGD